MLRGPEDPVSGLGFGGGGVWGFRGLGGGGSLGV